MQTNLNELLSKAKEMLQEELTNLSFKTWINPLEIDSINQNNIVLVTKDSFYRDTLQAKYNDLIANTFSIILNKECSVTFITKDDTSTISTNVEEKKSTIDNHYGYSNSSLNPKYTFETFVVGDNNRFAHAASLAVAEAPARSYNPLFLYGGVGLGKTHLMHSIGNEILRSNKNANILYVTSEKFTNEFINAIKDNTNEKFRNKYRNIDVY